MWWLWSLVVHVLHSPLFPSTPWLHLHRSVVLPETQICNTLENTYVLDFVPNVNVTFRVIARLLLGNEIPGTLRMFYFSSIQKQHLIQTLHRRIEQGDYITDNEQIGQILEKNGLNKTYFTSWNPEYNLYNHNCWHFCQRVFTELAQT